MNLILLIIVWALGIYGGLWLVQMILQIIPFTTAFAPFIGVIKNIYGKVLHFVFKIIIMILHLLWKIFWPSIFIFIFSPFSALLHVATKKHAEKTGQKPAGRPFTGKDSSFESIKDHITDATHTKKKDKNGKAVADQDKVTVMMQGIMQSAQGGWAKAQEDKKNKGKKGEKTEEEKKQDEEAKAHAEKINTEKRAALDKIHEDRENERSDAESEHNRNLANIRKMPEGTAAEEKTKKEALDAEEANYKKLQDGIDKRYKKLEKEKEEDAEYESGAKKPSVFHESPVIASVFVISLILFVISLGFSGMLPDIVMVILLSILFLSAIAYVVTKRKLSKKKVGKKYIIAVTVIAVLIISLLPGLMCDYLGFIPVLGYTCAMEETISQPVRTIVGSTIGSIFSGMKQWGLNIVKNMIPDNPLIKSLKVQSCYPFCTDPTGKDTSWHGLEVTRLEMIPHTIYSHQQFSIVIEFENKGKTPATFRPPIPEKGKVGSNFWERVRELFGIFDEYKFNGGLSLNCERTCKFNLGIAEKLYEMGGEELDEQQKEGDAEANCKTICPLDAATSVDNKPYVAGGCTAQVTYPREDKETGVPIDITDEDQNGDVYESGDLIPGELCTLDPGDIFRMTWYGMKVSDSMEIGLGEKKKPDVEMGLQYTYRPANDLIGVLSMMTAETQVAGAEEKSIGKIANKISQSYSPTGPLMMAMGTAESQVISGSPMFYMVQFTNKGKGTIPQIHTNYSMLFVPGSGPEDPSGFRLRLGDGCDFEWVKKESQGGDEIVKDTFPETCLEGWTHPDCEFYPGPNFVDGYTAYRPKDSIQTVGKGQDPLYNPLYYCVMDTPNEGGLKSYVFKYRVVEYAYQEEKAADITIIGTKISQEPGSTEGGGSFIDDDVFDDES